MRLRSKVLLAQGTGWILIGVVVVWAYRDLTSLGRASDAILRENYRSIQAAAQMKDALAGQELLLDTGSPVTSSVAETFEAMQVRFLQWLGRAKDNITIDGEAEIIIGIESRYTALLAAVRTSRERRSAGGAPSAATAEIPVIIRDLRERLDRLHNMNEVTMYQASGIAEQVARGGRRSILTLGTAAILLGIFFGFLQAERITRPLDRMVAAVRRIGSGDYSVRLPVTSADELGRLAEEVNDMTARLAGYHSLNIEQILAEQQKTGAVLASIQEPVFVIDRELNILSRNPAADLLSARFGPPGQLPGNLSGLLPDAELCTAIRSALKGGRGPELPEERQTLTFRDGETIRHYTLSLTPVRSEAGSSGESVLLLRDVTRLKELDRLKDEFVMAVSHELKTPLTSIEMSIDLLRDHALAQLDQDDQEMLHVASEEVNRLRALVTDLLDLSKIESGAITMQIAAVPLSRICAPLATLFHPQLEAKEVTLAIDLPPELPAVEADEEKIAWVLSNLIGNALRYSPPGKTIGLSARALGRYVHVAVRDEGPGIPREQHARIFQKFVQLSPAEGRQGTGLGLAISREIVRAHRGTIWVESQPGAGSVFTFTLPVAEN